MTCQECEFKLGMGEDVREHLAVCAECRLLAREMRLNAVALRGMRVRSRSSWVWVWAAAAAVVVMAIGLGVRKEKKAGESPALPIERAAVVEDFTAGHGPAPQVKKKHRAGRRPEQPLKVKMLTSDPDVVIYWIVSRKEGSE